jgi:hypothetical protein
VKRKDVLSNKPPKTGHLAHTFGSMSLPLEAMPSAADYYLGTRDQDGMPYSRESEECWKPHEDAEAALDAPSPHALKQRLTP